jgi:hypothetical protein
MEHFRTAVFVVNQAAFITYILKFWVPPNFSRKPPQYFLGMICSSVMTLTCFAYVTIDIMSHAKPQSLAFDVVVAASWAAIAAHDWRNWKNNRKGKKKAPKALGDKSRQALAKLKQSMPRIRVPSPVPIPS